MIVDMDATWRGVAGGGRPVRGGSARGAALTSSSSFCLARIASLTLLALHDEGRWEDEGEGKREALEESQWVELVHFRLAWEYGSFRVPARGNNSRAVVVVVVQKSCVCVCADQSC
jgi:hypothetical protein